MRAFALISGATFGLGLLMTQSSLPASLTRHYATLATVPSLNATYMVRTIGEAPAAYRLILSRPGAFRLTTPTGYVVGDGKTVTTYTTATKRYAQEPYTEAWATAFAQRPEVEPWGAFFVKEPQADVAAARSGATRTVGGTAVDEIEVTPKKAVPITLYIDKKLGVARGMLLKKDGKEILVAATVLELGKTPAAPETFAFVVPEGATKEESAKAGATYAQVQGILEANCLPCHAGDRARAGIVLTNHTGVIATVIAGKPAESLLIKSMRGDGVRKMPIGRPAVSEENIKAIESWILAGAKS